MSSPSSSPTILSHDAWLAARHELLLEEKKLTAHKDAVNEKRRNLGAYILSPQQISSWKFVNAQTNQTQSLYDLFGEKHNKLLIYHCMSFQSYPCGACAFVIKQFDAVYQALNQYTATVVIARAPSQSMKKIQNQCGWTIPCYTCDSMDFSNHFHTERTKDTEDGPKGYFGSIPGLSSLFYDRPSNNILHYYSTFNRGVEEVENYFGWLDRIPLAPSPNHPDRHHPKIPLPKDTPLDTTTKPEMQSETCCNEKNKFASQQQQQQQQVNLDTNGKLIEFPTMHYIFYEYKGDFSVICREAWTKLHTNMPEIKKLPGVKINAYLSLYKPKDGIYRAGVALDQPLANPPADLKYEHIAGGPYLSYRLTGAYSQLPAACGMVADLVKRNDTRIRADGWSIENYLNDPHTTPEAELQTDIMVPIYKDENKQ